MVQLSHLYMATGETITLTTQTFVSEVMSLLLKVSVYGETFYSTQHFKTKIMASSPITSQEINGETVETMTDLIFLGS